MTQFAPNAGVLEYVRIESKRRTRVIEINVHVMQFLVFVEESEVTLSNLGTVVRSLGSRWFWNRSEKFK